MDLSKLNRDDWIVGAAAVLLLIDLLFLPWHHESLAFGSVALSASQSATSSPDAVWGVLALLVVAAIVIDFALAKFSPQTVIPTSPLGRGMTRVAAAGLVLMLLLIKLLANAHYLGFGAYLGFVLAAAVTVGALRVART